MNSGKEGKAGHSRNNTPTYIRFKRKSTSKPDPNEQPHSERSNSRASKASMEHYDKRILNLSKLKKQLNLRTREEPAKRRREGLEVTSSRKGSVPKEEETRVVPLGRRSGSNKALHVVSKEKGRGVSGGRRNEESLEREENYAKKNRDSLTTMMQQQFAPNYMKQLKIKKMEQREKGKTGQGRRRFLKVDIEMKGEDELKHYQLFEELGKGAYGIVKMGISLRTNEKVAVKIYDKHRLDQPNKIKNLEREINILAKLNHPVIARLITAIEAPDKIYLIQEYGGANSLYNYLLSKPQHRMQESEAKQFFRTIAETLQYLHQRNIVHRDIKAENILLNRHKQLKLIDFGFSLESVPPATIDTFCGTPTYMAPEIVSKRDHVPIYTDMWSLGIFLFVMLQGNYPFRARNENDLFEKIRRGQFEYIHRDISEKSKQVIQRLVRVDPLERLTSRQMDAAFWDWFMEGEAKEDPQTYATTCTN